jgi:indole-3-glycerol phosphate synthase
MRAKIVFFDSKSIVYMATRQRGLGVKSNKEMNILEEIIANKEVEVAEAKRNILIADLEKMPEFGRKCLSLVAALTAIDGTGIIAEFKRKSPSKGEINTQATAAATTAGYYAAGAAGVSVLTDEKYFGGSKHDLMAARASSAALPLLRKDFIIDPYQLYEAKAWGADVILLIAANLSANQISQLSQKAKALGLEVLLEVHNKEEIEKSMLDFVDIVGVNNRNLKNFSENNINASLDLFQYIPSHKVKISESCIGSPEAVKKLKSVGYSGFLMGENFMKTANPAESLANFVRQLA